ncbi:ras-related GTP-binding protein D isoform X2 [Amphiprion ocellaris]|uniref:ras-related GTP-binding protein D isoform X2 n=1 Tax=Amphiprion ocellaris TaxID=80972 RepID=UPI002410DBAE|nr:ras-related GTP-binding protein D isoform X2 [Amphiprion ocellaris]
MTSDRVSSLGAEEDDTALAYYDDDDLEAFSVAGLGCEDGVPGFSDSLNGDVKPRILLMGLRRSGKSSIQKVVFHKMSPNETLFLESTNKICREDVSSSSFVSFQIWDFPGQIDFFDPSFDYEMIFIGTGALIFVIDSQDDYVEALSRLHLTVTRAYKVNPDIHFEVFIHKVDGLSDDHKIEKQRDIHKRANDDLADTGLERIHLSFYLTSIYDHSIFEAFSKVVQKLIPQLPTLENLLNIFISFSAGPTGSLPACLFRLSPWLPPCWFPSRLSLRHVQPPPIPAARPAAAGPRSTSSRCRSLQYVQPPLTSAARPAAPVCVPGTAGCPSLLLPSPSTSEGPCEVPKKPPLGCSETFMGKGPSSTFTFGQHT